MGGDNLLTGIVMVFLFVAIVYHVSYQRNMIPMIQLQALFEIMEVNAPPKVLSQPSPYTPDCLRPIRNEISRKSELTDPELLKLIVEFIAYRITERNKDLIKKQLSSYVVPTKNNV